MTRRRTLVASVALAIGMFAGADAQVRDPGSRTPPPGAGSIAGRVEMLDADERKPLRRATVLLVRDTDGQSDVAATDADGRYRFDGLAPGGYRVAVSKAGFVPLSPPPAFEVGRDRETTVNLETERAGALEGRFVDHRGVPIERLTVTADRLAEGPAGGVAASHSSVTDDLGRYRIHTLPPGRYRVHARPLPPASGERLFHPGTETEAEASIISIGRGQTAGGLDFTVPIAAMSPIAAEAIAAVEREIAATPDTPGLSGRVTGQVTRSDLGVPIANATVSLKTTTGLTLRTALTDGSGEFSFSRLPEDRFFLSASAHGYIDLNATLRGPAAAGTIVTILEGARVRLDLALTPASAIEVRVVDEFGDPAPGVIVQVSTQVAAAGPPLVLVGLNVARSGPTDDRGWFRVPRLPAGDYYVVLLPEPFARSGPAVFAPTFFPGTTSPDAASAVRLSAGMDAHASLALAAAAADTVAGVVVGADGRRMPGTGVVLIPAFSSQVWVAAVAKTSAGADGSFAFARVPEGTYIVQGLASGAFGTLPVTVVNRASEPVPVVLTMAPLGTTRGRIIFDGDAPVTLGGNPRPELVAVVFRPTDVTSGPIAAEPVGRMETAINKRDETFEIRNIAYRGVLAVSTPESSPWILSRVTLQGRDITDVPYDFQSGTVEGVEVILTNRTGTITGTVSGDSESGSDADVFLFGADDASLLHVARTMRRVRTDLRGAFTLSRLLPGRYYALALTPRSPIPGATDLLVLRPRATLLTVPEGTAPPVRLTLVK